MRSSLILAGFLTLPIYFVMNKFSGDAHAGLFPSDNNVQLMQVGAGCVTIKNNWNEDVQFCIGERLEVTSLITDAAWADIANIHLGLERKSQQGSVEGQIGDQAGVLSDHPVTSITYWSALKFANEVSLRHGFAPAYPLQDLSWSGEFAKGTLETADLSLEKVILHDNPFAEGFRLPNLKEMQYFVAYAVAHGDKFLDATGSTGEFLHGKNERISWWSKRSDRLDGYNVLVRGPNYMPWHSTEKELPGISPSTTGFRLVRAINPL